MLVSRRSRLLTRNVVTRLVVDPDLFRGKKTVFLQVCGEMCGAEFAQETRYLLYKLFHACFVGSVGTEDADQFVFAINNFPTEFFRLFLHRVKEFLCDGELLRR